MSRGEMKRFCRDFDFFLIFYVKFDYVLDWTMNARGLRQSEGQTTIFFLGKRYNNHLGLEGYVS
jgi:hypothetical protein